MKRSAHPAVVGFFSSLVLLALGGHAPAAITVGGDPRELLPADPATWTASGSAMIGLQKTGTLTLTNGSQVASLNGYVGYGVGATGSATLVGPGSAWTCASEFHVGYQGTGTLNLLDGGKINCVYGAVGGGVSGTATVAGPGSEWACSNIMFVAKSGTASLNVSNGGVITSLYADIGENFHSNGTVTIAGPGSKWTNKYVTEIGFDAHGTVNIADGGSMTSESAELARAGGHGILNVTGIGSTWATTTYLIAGGSGTYMYGTGEVRISDGGLVTTGRSSALGAEAGSTGLASVSGPGSRWIVKEHLTVGAYGLGTLTIADNGQAAAGDLAINAASAAHLFVSGDNMIVVGSASTPGAVANSGKIHLYADPFLAPGTYRPISESNSRPITWSGAGTCDALGATWDNDQKTLTVSPATSILQDDMVTPADNARLIVTAPNGHRVGVSFGLVPADTSFSAREMLSEELVGLPSDQAILSAWAFTTTYVGSAVLAFDVGQAASELRIWRYSNGQWNEYIPPHRLTLGHDGIARFTVPAFSSYAVTVPEPAAVGVLLLSSLALLSRRPKP